MNLVERRCEVRRARVVLVATALAAAVAMGSGCGSSGDTATSVSASNAPETTAAAPTSSTTERDPVAGAAALGADVGGKRDASSTTRGADAMTGADEAAPDVTWALTATEYRGDDGLLVSYDCPPDGTAGTVWGSDVYTDDSSVCTAAVHAGLITDTDGGEVVIEIVAGLDEYTESTANGVTTLPYGPWLGSFTFPDR